MQSIQLHDSIVGHSQKIVSSTIHYITLHHTLRVVISIVYAAAHAQMECTITRICFTWEFCHGNASLWMILFIYCVQNVGADGTVYAQVSSRQIVRDPRGPANLSKTNSNQACPGASNDTYSSIDHTARIPQVSDSQVTRKHWSRFHLLICT